MKHPSALSWVWAVLEHRWFLSTVQFWNTARSTDSIETTGPQKERHPVAVSPSAPQPVQAV
jgi:hypothetical protein